MADRLAQSFSSVLGSLLLPLNQKLLQKKEFFAFLLFTFGCEKGITGLDIKPVNILGR